MRDETDTAHAMTLSGSLAGEGILSPEPEGIIIVLIVIRIT